MSPRLLPMYQHPALNYRKSPPPAYWLLPRSCFLLLTGFQQTSLHNRVEVLFILTGFFVNFYLENHSFLRYTFHMTIIQTVEIPANRRITLEVPRETPTGRASVEFKIIPFVNKNAKPRMTEAEELELINRHADELNREAMDVFSYQVPLWDEEEE